MYKDRQDYIRQLFAVETPALKEVRSTLTADNDQIAVEPEDGKFLQFLVRLIDAKKIVEIGTLAGYSALWMAGALLEDGHLYTIEKDEQRFTKAKANLQKHDLKRQITLLSGTALDVLPTLVDEGPFDVVFIDADKLNYLHYLDWAEKNLRTGGLIVADNTFLSDAVWNDAPVERIRDTAREAMREFNRRLADSSRYHSVMLPTSAGMTIGQKIFTP